MTPQERRVLESIKKAKEIINNQTPPMDVWFYVEDEEESKMTPQEQKVKTRWTKADDDLLVKLTKAYCSYADMARRLERTEFGVKKRLSILNIVHPAYAKKRGIPAMKELESKDERAYTSYGQRTTLDKLKPSQCHFPLFDNSGYCGCDEIHGKNYCKNHFELCYVIPKKSRLIDWQHWKPQKV